MHLYPGTLLQGGKYRIIRFIKSGGFGCTYEAEHTVFSKRVAIKEFFPKDFCNRDGDALSVTVGTQSKKPLVAKLKKKFIDEAVVLNGLEHSGIVRVSDVFEENDTAYYVMDYIEGGSLSGLVDRDGALEESKALAYIREICSALEYVHSRNRLHLDLKPGNIMLDSAGHTILIDFGTSKQYDEVNGENSSTLMGHTPGYAPLEMYQKGGVSHFTPTTDVYSLGATLYKLLTGERPPEASEVNENGLPALSSRISPAVRNAIEKAMSPRRKDRPQSVAEFRRLLESAPARPRVVIGEEAQLSEPSGHSRPERHQNNTPRHSGPSRSYVPPAGPVVSKSVMPEHASPKPRRRGLVWGVLAGIVAVIAIFLCRTNFEIEKPGDILSASSAVDLADGGETANSYIVSTSGTYKFKPVKGNSRESVGSVSSVEVLWESFGTSIAPKVGDLVEAVNYDAGYIVFSTPSSFRFREGNAVIAAKNSSGEILWSWHIWLTDQPKGQTYYNNAGTMMDRNLGATTADAGDVGALGLLYQWGRKDPFLGSSSIRFNNEAKSTKSWPSPVSASTSKGTVDYATENPMTFITADSSSERDWHYSSRNNNLWKSSKTIYDPCPAGWRVPDGGDNGVWSKACGSSYFSDYPYDSPDGGMNFSGEFGSASIIWYPASGFRGLSDGSLADVGYGGGYWSVTPSSDYAYFLYFSDRGDVGPSSACTRGVGLSVRCLQE